MIIGTACFDGPESVVDHILRHEGPPVVYEIATPTPSNPRWMLRILSSGVGDEVAA